MFAKYSINLFWIVHDYSTAEKTVKTLLDVHVSNIFVLCLCLCLSLSLSLF